MKFKYTARNEYGQVIQGSAEAPNERALAEQLRQQKLMLTRAEDSTTADKKKFSLRLSFGGRIKTVDKIFFTQNLQVMVKAGLSVSLALNTLAQQTNNDKFRTILLDISQRVDKGDSLSDALAAYPKVFPELFVNMVRAGERGGKLDEVLLQLSVQLRKSHQLVAKVRSALTYPIIVVIAMVGIATAMMIFVVPKITGIFAEVNVTLPLPTRLLMAISNFLVANTIWVALGLIVLTMSFLKIIRTSRGKKIWHELLLKLPVLSPILRKINLAKFARTFSSLLKTDIPIVQAFQITASTLGNVAYRTVVSDAAERVKKGVSVATILGEQPKLFPPLIVQMVSVGEETGTIDTILEELAAFYEEDVDRTMSNLSTILEPILILILGLGVGGLAVSIILPIYTLTQSI